MRVIDGDTIEAVVNGQTERIRYIGVNTPERGQPGADEATRFNQQLLDVGPLWIAADVADRDRYGRLLRYLLVGGTFVNLALVESGMAATMTIPPNVRCAELFLEAERAARAAGVGLWATEPNPTTAPTSASSRVVPNAASRCHPSYPDICLPPPPPDLDCSDISARRFRVLHEYGDPHKLDRDKDGIGCER